MPVVCRCMDQSYSQLRVLGLSGMFSSKIAPSHSGIVTPVFLGPNPLINIKRHLDRFSHFCVGPKCYAVPCIVNGKEKPKIVPSLWHFITLLEKDQSTAISNIHKNFVRDQTCCSRDECILCYNMLQVTAGAIANLSTQISQLWYICRCTTIMLSNSILP